MQRLLSIKFVLIALITLGVLFPLGMIGDLVVERQRFHDTAVTEMSASSTASQLLRGPLLQLPCEETYLVQIYDHAAQTHEPRAKTRDCTTYVLPDKLDITGTLASDVRRRGIHEALFYNSTLRIRAHFTVPSRFGSNEPETQVRLGDASINVGVGDPRGIMNVPSLLVGDREYAFAPGTLLAVLGNGIHAMLGEVAVAQTIEVSFELNLRGLGLLELVPVGRQTTVALDSPWRHPSFVGRFLPVSRRITDEGFAATWSTSHFATGLEQLFEQHHADRKPAADIDRSAFGVNLLDPVDVYTQADRAVKYGFLFVLLTFVALLATELFRGLRLHPVQYGMVGIALALFFLLLLSLAEHLGFRVAYLIAASACVALLSYYLRHAARSIGVGAAFAAGLSALYGFLYGVLSAEDYALLTGSLFVFSVVAVLMILTRNIDWYALGMRGLPADAPAPVSAPELAS